MTGAELCQELARDPRTTDIPIVMITAGADPTTILAEVPHLATCLTKPVMPASIPELVAQILHQHRTRSGQATPAATSTASSSVA